MSEQTAVPDTQAFSELSRSMAQFGGVGGGATAPVAEIGVDADDPDADARGGTEGAARAPDAESIARSRAPGAAGNASAVDQTPAAPTASALAEQAAPPVGVAPAPAAPPRIGDRSAVGLASRIRESLAPDGAAARRSGTPADLPLSDDDAPRPRIRPRPAPDPGPAAADTPAPGSRAASAGTIAASAASVGPSAAPSSRATGPEPDAGNTVALIALKNRLRWLRIAKWSLLAIPASLCAFALAALGWRLWSDLTRLDRVLTVVDQRAATLDARLNAMPALGDALGDVSRRQDDLVQGQAEILSRIDNAFEQIAALQKSGGAATAPAPDARQWQSIETRLQALETRIASQSSAVNGLSGEIGTVQRALSEIGLLRREVQAILAAQSDRASRAQGNVVATQPQTPLRESGPRYPALPVRPGS